MAKFNPRTEVLQAVKGIFEHLGAQFPDKPEFDGMLSTGEKGVGVYVFLSKKNVLVELAYEVRSGAFFRLGDVVYDSSSRRASPEAAALANRFSSCGQRLDLGGDITAFAKELISKLKPQGT